MTYQDYVAKVGAKAAVIADLEAKADRIYARARKRSFKVEDAGPLDIVAEQLDNMRARAEILKWAMNNPKKKPPKDLLERFDAAEKEAEDNAKYKEEKKAKFARFKDRTGEEVTFRGKYGNDITGVVISQRAGKWSGEPKYKVKTDQGTWTVPHVCVACENPTTQFDQLRS